MGVARRCHGLASGIHKQQGRLGSTSAKDSEQSSPLNVTTATWMANWIDKMLACTRAASWQTFLCFTSALERCCNQPTLRIVKSLFWNDCFLSKMYRLSICLSISGAHHTPDHTLLKLSKIRALAWWQWCIKQKNLDFMVQAWKITAQSSVVLRVDNPIEADSKPMRQSHCDCYLSIDSHPCTQSFCEFFSY